MVATTTLPATTRSPHRVARVAVEVAAALTLLGAAFVAGRTTVDDGPADRLAPVVHVGDADPALSTCHTGTPC